MENSEFNYLINTLPFISSLFIFQSHRCKHVARGSFIKEVRRFESRRVNFRVFVLKSVNNMTYSRIKLPCSKRGVELFTSAIFPVCSRDLDRSPLNAVLTQKHGETYEGSFTRY